MVLGIDEDLVFPDQTLSVYEGGIAPWRGDTMSEYLNELIFNAKKFDFPIHRPIKDLTKKEIQLLWEGNNYFLGLNKFFKYLDCCRRKNLKMMVYEKQGAYSGLMLDFDIYQDKSESFINESMVYLSPTFIKQIQKIDSPISQELIDIQGVDIKDDISFIDFDNTPGMLSFKTMKNLKKSIEDITGYLKSSGDSLAAKYDSIGNDFEKSKELIDDLEFKKSLRHHL
jgi:hypothetical protein